MPPAVQYAHTLTTRRGLKTRILLTARWSWVLPVTLQISETAGATVEAERTARAPANPTKRKPPAQTPPLQCLHPQQQQQLHQQPNASQSARPTEDSPPMSSTSTTLQQQQQQRQQQQCVSFSLIDIGRVSSAYIVFHFFQQCRREGKPEKKEDKQQARIRKCDSKLMGKLRQSGSMGPLRGI
eukprot:42695-Pelagomonas_calceolata.AAC.11